MGRLRRLLFLLAMLGHLALLLNCSSNSTSTPSDDAKEGGDTVLQGPHSTLTIPSGTFPKIMNATLSETDASLNKPSLNVLSKQINLEFSEIQVAQNEGGMLLEIHFDPGPDSAPAAMLSQDKTLYFMVKAEGGPALDEAPQDHDWLSEVGTFDPVKSSMALKLFATAKKFSIIAVAGPKIPIVIGDASPQFLSSGNFLKYQVPNANPNFDLSRFPCAVACNPAEFPSGNSDCGAEVLGRLAGECDQAIQGLAQENLKYAYWDRQTIGRLKAAGYSVIVSSSTSDDTEVNPVYVFPPQANPNPGPCGGSGGYVAFYSAVNRILQFFTTDSSDSPFIFPHEICHAIQFFDDQSLEVHRAIPPWVKEGTAAFCETYPLAPADRILRRRGTPRNFAFPLDGQGISAEDGVSEGIPSQDFLCKMGNLPYKTSEFWAFACQGELSCLNDVFVGMKGANAENSLQISDQIFSHWGKSLETIYTDLIHSRDLDPQYPYCRDLEIAPEEVSDFATKPFSATCRNLSIASDPNGCYQIQSKLEEDANVLLIQNGISLQPGSTHTFQGNSIRLWILNREFSRNENVSLQLKQFPCGCGDGTTANGEECDDGNNLDGDGCSSDCKREATCPNCSCSTQYTDSCFLIEPPPQDYPFFCCGPSEQIVFTTDCLPSCTIDNVTATYCSWNPVGCEPI